MKNRGKNLLGAAAAGVIILVGIYYIAVIWQTQRLGHHLFTRTRRARRIGELARFLAVGGAFRFPSEGYIGYLWGTASDLSINTRVLIFLPVPMWV
jgi:hypothetical protein